MANDGSCSKYQIGAAICEVYRKAEQAALCVAERIAEIIREKERDKKHTVLGLATGSTPVPVYRELIRMHRNEGLSFKNVYTFNLDEYYELSADHPESYAKYMETQLFRHIDIPLKQTYLPNGLVQRDDLPASCIEYENKIEELGGLDFQILGIGQTGHIGFNEPGSSQQSRTRLITLDPITRVDAARDFVGLENVPRFAITMGVGTILEAREIALLAWGKGKAPIIKKAFESSPSEEVPASLLQNHGNLNLYLNEAAASELEAVCYPWTVRKIQWTERTIKKAVHSVALRENKPILKLVERDYQRYGLEDLLNLHGPAYDLNIRVFKSTQNTITGWPGGKSGVDDRARPVPSEPGRKRIVIIGSEPGVEAIGLGATLNRLQRQGHDVTLAFLASGSKAVREKTVNRFQSLLGMLKEERGLSLDLKGLSKGESTKRLIRKHQSQLAASQLALAVAPDFLNLPFYDEGGYRKFEPLKCDVQSLADFLNRIRPHQIYTTGKEADPNSLEGVCWGLLEDSRSLWNDWSDYCQIWLFREGGECWGSHEIDMAVPVSPDERSLKEEAMAEYLPDLFQVAKKSGVEVANVYDALGLPEYEEIEAFKLHKPELNV